MAAEVFDMAVAAGVFDRPVELCFQGEGLHHLAHHEPSDGERSVARLWQSAELFGVNAFYALSVERDAFNKLNPGPVSERVQWLETGRWQTTLAKWEQVVVL